jgi:hypothetical protein
LRLARDGDADFAGRGRSDGGQAVPLVLYAVNVWITWTDDDHTREVRLDTEQIGQPVGSG